MTAIVELALANLFSPMLLFFLLGFFAALGRSDLSFPEAAAKALSLYLLLAIGFKGGAAVAASGFSWTLAAALAAGIVLSAALPLIAFALLQTMTRLSRIDAAAVAAHYGSISIVTFVAASTLAGQQGLKPEGFMVAVAAAMEAPAILTALFLVQRGRAPSAGRNEGQEADAALNVRRAMLREVLMNGSIVLLTGAFLIGMISGTQGLETISPFIVDPFAGILCLFLLDMGLIAGRGIRTSGRELTPPLIAFGVIMPLVGACCGLVCGLLVGLSTGGVMLLMTLSASASYIAVPAAMRVALPEARPSIYVTLSLGITFPFNLLLGLPLYSAVATLAVPP